jgi:hypothetical protein
VNNGFGLNFLRFVCEEDTSSWSQVFARLPFDEVELKQKGALFGVIKTEKTENWADDEAEMTNWVEEFFNSAEKDADLSGMIAVFLKKYPNIDFVWVWVVLVSGVRKIKMVGNGKGGLLIARGGNLIDIGKNLENEKVITGELKDGDVVRFWIGNLNEDFETWDKARENTELGSYAGFKIVADNLAIEEERVVLEEVVENTNEVVVMQAEKVEGVKSGVEVFERETLAGDKYVGKIGIWQKLKNRLGERKSVNISTDQKTLKQKRLSLLLGVLFLGLLAVSLMLGSVRKKNQENSNKWVSFSQPIEKNINEAMGLIKLNPAGSKKLVEDARQAFDLRKLEFSGDDFKSKAKDLDKKIAEAWVSVSGEKGGNVTELVNLELIRAGVNANKMSFVSDGKFVVTSSSLGIVMSIDIKTKEVKVVAGKGAGLGWLDAVSDGTKYYVMSKSGMFPVGEESSSMTFDTAVTSPLSFSKFGANLYVLEKNNKEVFKYPLTDSGFGERVRWLKEGQLIASSPVDLDIDVDIWVLEEKGQIERFRRGVKEVFSISGLSPDMEFEKVAVEKEGDRIALLSSKSGSVVFCSKKDGTCSQQIKSEKLKEAKDIEFDGENRLIVLFPGAVGVLN